MKNSNNKRMGFYGIAMCTTGQKKETTSEYFPSLELYAAYLV